MQSYFSLLQNNVLNERRWDTREELRFARRDLDRADLPPSTPPTTPRQTDPFEFEINTQTATLAAWPPSQPTGQQPRLMAGGSTTPCAVPASWSASAESTACASQRDRSGDVSSSEATVCRKSVLSSSRRSGNDSRTSVGNWVGNVDTSAFRPVSSRRRATPTRTLSIGRLAASARSSPARSVTASRNSRCANTGAHPSLRASPWSSLHARLRRPRWQSADLPMAFCAGAVGRFLA